MRLESFVRGSWMSPGHELAQIHSAVTGDVVAEVANGGLDMGEVLAYARQVGGPALRRLTFHQRGEMLKASCHLSIGAQGPALQALLPDRHHPHRQLHRRGWRHRHAFRLCVQGTARAAQRHLPSGWKCRTPFQGRQLRRPARDDAADRRRRAHQRLQFPLLGHAREARAGDPGRRAGGDEAGDDHILCGACARAHDRGIPHPSRRRAPMHRRLDGRSLRSPDLPGCGVVHGFGRHGAEAAAASGDRARSRCASLPSATRSMRRSSPPTRGPARRNSTSSSRRSRKR